VADTASTGEDSAPPLDPPLESEEIANEKLPDQTLDRAAFRLREAMSDLIRADLVTVRRKDHSVELEIKSNVLFASGSATISDLAVEPLSGIAAVMRDIPNSIQVEGFTDNVPIKTTVFPSNWELSAARAASVVHLLMKSGVRPERMTAIGYGEYRPAHSNDTEEGRNLNRRVVVVILGEDGRRDTDEDMISPAGTPKLNLSGIGHG
jgi:chemotaxis protein MotB